MTVVWALWKREILRFVRQRSRWIGSLATPLLFWLLIGGGMGQSFQSASSQADGYLEFFFPGILSLSVLFTAIFSTLSVIEDRNEGFLQGVLSAPIPRTSLIFAKLLAGASLGLLQGGLLLFSLFFLSLSVNLLSLLQILLLLFCMGAALTSLGFFFAWKINSVSGYHGVMNLILMPLWILSGSVFPLDGSFKIYQWLAKLNPLTYGIQSLRDLLERGHSHIYGLSLVSMFVFMLIFTVLSSRSLKKLSGV